MSTKTRIWIHKLLATIIGGGAGAVTSTIASSMLAPDQFNLGTQLGHTVKLMAVTFVVNGALSMFFYLKQSPLPDDDDTVIANPTPKTPPTV